MDGDALFEDSLVGIKKDLCLDLPDAFWQQTADWNFQDFVRELLKKRKMIAPATDPRQAD